MYGYYSAASLGVVESVRSLGSKYYELTNHLSNVLAVVSDRAIPMGSGSTVDYYRADIVSANDYYPFGMIMPGRKFSSDGYRYGFQGQEKDDELKGEGNSVNYKYRMHDTRIGRFFAVDPLASKYPHNSTYAFSENQVIDAVELEGLEKVSVNNSGINPESHENDDGTYSFSLGETKYDNVAMIEVDGVQYFDVGSGIHKGQHLFYDENGWRTGPAVDDDPSMMSVEIWYYVFNHKFDDPSVREDNGHAQVYNPNLNVLVEVHYPRTDMTTKEAVKNGRDNDPNTHKSIGYYYEFNTVGQAKKYYEFHFGRHNVDLYPVVIKNPNAANIYMKNMKSMPWEYNFFTNNCKHYSFIVLRKGGADIKLRGPAPKNWINSNRVMRWETADDVGKTPW